MAVIVHDIPGCLRVVVPRLKRNQAASEQACARVRAITGVTGVCVNALTGSLVVLYDEGAGTRQEIIRVVGRLGPGDAARLTPSSALGEGGFKRTGSKRTGSVGPRRTIGTMVADALVEALVERAVRAAAAALV